MQNCILLVNACLFSIFAFTACNTEPEEDNLPTLDYLSLVDSLHTAGATVAPAGELSQPFFSVQVRLIKVNGADVQVLEYAHVNDTKDEAEKISSDGQWVGDTHVNWVDVPHFFSQGRLIVLYVGDESVIIKLLEAVLGSQFAGG